MSKVKICNLDKLQVFPCEKTRQRIREKCKRDIETKKVKDGNLISTFNTMVAFNIFLPPLERMHANFKSQYIRSQIDLDMKNELQKQHVINWLKEFKKLYPFKTTGDGNCLLHAVSLAMWGVEDTDGFLRHMLYLNMVSFCDHNSKLKDRFHFDHAVRKQNFRLLSSSLEIQEDINRELKSLVDMAKDERPINGFLRYKMLEKIHVYVLCNMIRRPIIILSSRMCRSIVGTSLQENELRGIYLPLEWDCKDTLKTPIVLGYSMNHFCPLLMQRNSVDRPSHGLDLVPLLCEDLSPLPVQYLFEHEVGSDVLHNYLRYEIFRYQHGTGTVELPCALLEHREIFEELNIVRQHREHCEKQFLSFFNKPQGTGRVLCIMPGCEMYGDATWGNKCSKCFMEETRLQAEKEGHHLPSQPTAPPPGPGDEVEDEKFLSIIGERCKAKYCRNHCSVSTYPYCHECAPKVDNNPVEAFNMSVQEKHGNGDSMIAQPSDSLPETSKSYPGQLEKSDELFGEGDDMPQGKMARSESSSASDPMAKMDDLLENNPDLNFQCNDETSFVGSRRRPTESSEGTPSPGAGDISPASEAKYPPGCSAKSFQFPENPFRPLTGFSQQSPSKVRNEIISPPPPVLQAQGNSSGLQANMRQKMKKLPVENSQNGQVMSQCNTTGCEGLIAMGELCLSCYERELVESMAPELSSAEQRILNPVVKSSKDKEYCASQICNRRVYPPKKLCDECTRVLTEHYTKDLNAGQSLEQCRVKTPEKIAMTGSRCVDENCDRFGDPNMQDRCTFHFKMWQEACGITEHFGYMPNSNYVNYKVKSAPERRNGHGQTDILKEKSKVNANKTYSEPIMRRDKFHDFNTKMYNLENSRKSDKCISKYCGNYGNPKNGGYCNSCAKNAMVMDGSLSCRGSLTSSM